MFGRKHKAETSKLELDSNLDSLIEKRIEEKKLLEKKESDFGIKHSKRKKKKSRYFRKAASKPTGTKKVGFGYSNFGKML